MTSARFEIRAATPDDAEAIRQIHLSAFPTAAEADLVQRLQGEDDTALSLVASDSGAIVGHILFSRMRVEADGRSLVALGLAPVAVVPERQGEGIGSALIDEGLRAAQIIGAQMVFVLGEPEYYGRFGFTAEAAMPFRSPYAGPYFQAKALSSDVRAPESGSADYAPAFGELE